MRGTTPVPASPVAWRAATGAVLAALAIGLSAYASHGVEDPHARSNLQTAALYAFGHGVALAALWPRAAGRLAKVALLAVLLGTLLFAGSLAGGALAGLPAGLAPAGAMRRMAGWVAAAVSVLRAR